MSDKKQKKAKGGKKGKGGGGNAVSVANHPKATAAVSRLKGWTGLIAFVFVTYKAHGSGATLENALVKGLVAGWILYLMVWALAVTAWRQLVVGEVNHARRPPEPVEVPGVD